MNKEEFKKLYPDVDNDHVTPEEFHRPVKVTNAWEWIPKNGIEEFRKDIMFWQGFDMAIDLVMKVFEEEGDYQVPMNIRESIIEEVERYKKDE